VLNKQKVGKNGAMLLTRSLKIPQKTLHWRLGFWNHCMGYHLHNQF